MPHRALTGLHAPTPDDGAEILRRLSHPEGQGPPTTSPPVLVPVMDDLRWSDEDSAQVLLRVLWGADPPPLLLVGAARDEGAPDPVITALRTLEGTPAVAWRELLVEALPATEARALVRGLDPAGAAGGISARETQLPLKLSIGSSLPTIRDSARCARITAPMSL